MLEKIIENEYLPQLTKDTANLLVSEQKQLSKIKWHSQESNTDEGFSKLAKKCCEKAFKKINKKTFFYCRICQLSKIN